MTVLHARVHHKIGIEALSELHRQYLCGLGIDTEQSMWFCSSGTPVSTCDKVELLPWEAMMALKPRAVLPWEPMTADPRGTIVQCSVTLVYITWVS